MRVSVVNTAGMITPRVFKIYGVPQMIATIFVLKETSYMRHFFLSQLLLRLWLEIWEFGGFLKIVLDFLSPDMVNSCLMDNSFKQIFGNLSKLKH